MLDVALIGAGVMGTNHARIIRSDHRSRLRYVVDQDRARAEAVAAANGASTADRIEDVLGQVDAVVVAVSTEQHLAVALQVIAAGIPVLVEKPLASDSRSAQQIVEAVARSRSLLAVGHVERFNPAVLELENVVSDVVHADIRRVSSFTPRARESVVRDLMIHDLDLARMLARSEVVDVQAIGSSTRTETLDLAIALLTFANGVTAALTTSRIGQQKIREIDLTQRENFVHVDLMRGDLSIHQVHHSEFLAEGGPRYSQAGVVEIPYLSNRGEPLALQWGHFTHCVTDRVAPRVDGEAGCKALELAELVEQRACTKG